MDDAELVARLKRYDAEAVVEVVSQYGPMLHRYVSSLVGDRHLAEDIVSGTYIRVLDRIGTYTYRGVPFRAWLIQVARNMALNALRRERPSAGDAALGNVVAATVSPEQAVEKGEERAALQQALLGLTTDQQQVLLLRFVAEHSTAEVARILRKSEGSVKQLQFRGLRSLARLLTRTGGGDGG
jgi:RNA polymerase sigma-70 factor (ECF subfamily)